MEDDKRLCLSLLILEMLGEVGLAERELLQFLCQRFLVILHAIECFFADF